MQDESSHVATVDDDKVCVVAAAAAWPFYRLVGAYVCQENRYIQEDTGRLGFYSSRLIHGVAARIEAIFPSVQISDAMAAVHAFDPHPRVRRLGEVLDACMEQGWTDPAVQVVLLSREGEPGTETFEPVRHEGKTAWTMKQRYTTLGALRAAGTTDDLNVEAVSIDA